MIKSMTFYSVVKQVCVSRTLSYPLLRGYVTSCICGCKIIYLRWVTVDARFAPCYSATEFAEPSSISMTGEVKVVLTPPSLESGACSD